jgi:hypothetical protein
MSLRMRKPIRGSRQRGALLGVVLVLLGVLFAAGAFALWSSRSDLGAAGRDRLSRQLFDCAEQGLAFGKQYFSTTARNQWNQYLAASNVCSSALPCAPNGPFPTGGAVTGPPGYPDLAPFTSEVVMDPSNIGNAEFRYTVGIYNDPGDTDPWHDNNNRIVVYSRCLDLRTLQTRAVQALLSVPPALSSDYQGQAGRGFRNQGNQNF